MSTSIYDTAWASMIIKNAKGKRQWLFPSSFDQILQQQKPEGGWERLHGEPEIDSILNSMSALLALLQHRKEYLKLHDAKAPKDLEARIEMASSWLEMKLNTWDIDGTDHVCFELLVPVHLKLLKEFGVTYDFPAHFRLMHLYQSKISKMDVNKMYANKGTFLHSLEAFIGLIDFDRMKDKKLNGSFMSSPASTSAYMIYATAWDRECESYLETVFVSGQGKGNGAFPSAFPSEIFELTWALSTLLESGFSRDELGESSLQTLGNSLRSKLEASGGVIGFTAGEIADADDTAKCLLTLSLLGAKESSAEKLISSFFNGNHFRTYSAERNPSLSANCNVLSALLHHSGAHLYIPEILSAANFVCSAGVSGEIRDKWNISKEYSNMLLAQSLTKFLRYASTSENGQQMIPAELLESAAKVAVHILTETLRSQSSSGCWGHDCCERTAYAILTLVTLTATLPVTGLQQEVQDAVSSGQEFLTRNKHNWGNGSQLWVEKVSYSSLVLSRIYCLSALRSSPIGPLTSSSDKVNIALVLKFSKFFSTIPLFVQQTTPALKLSIVEGLPFLSHLRRIGSNIFRHTRAQEDKYLSYIPATWTMCNNLGEKNGVQTSVLTEMMVLSMLNYQVDEYMETVVASQYQGDLDAAKRLVRRICEKVRVDLCKEDSEELATNNTSGADHKYNNDLDHNLPPQKHCKTGHQAEAALEIETSLIKYASHILRHPSVAKAPSLIRTTLFNDLQTFLLAHITQLSDNKSLFPALSPNIFPRRMSRTLHEWVHTTGAFHTSCCMSFTFFCCLIFDAAKNKHSNNNDNSTWIFESPMKKYLADDVCLHLATMCRMYNDLGSAQRDCDEGNLNCLDFFSSDTNITRQAKCRLSIFKSGDSDSGMKDNCPIVELETKKGELLRLSQYERECLNLSWKRLKELGLNEKVERALQLFIDVTDLYGQIYVARDIGIAVSKE
ncbi:hypothetical protein B0J14DRAFT_614498 [Halenospora varia]|nr:hypothetical protein B0J14DRAFT_614498 [Halenospora varia]